MRILWFTNIPLPALVAHWGGKASGTGWWMHALAEQLRDTPESTRLGIIYAGAGCTNEHVEIGGIDYFSVPQSKLATISGIGMSHVETKCFKRFEQIIHSFRPDVIHIHGTERFYGLLKTKIKVSSPVVVSLQGLMGEYAKYAWGDKSFLDVCELANIWEITRCCPTLRTASLFRKRGVQEKQILASVDGVIGRTDWDRGYANALAPRIPYFHVDEMLRPAFHHAVWAVETAKRFTLYTTARLGFLKGMHVLLEAVVLLKRDFPDVELRVAGGINASPECKYMLRMVEALDLQDNITFLGWLPADQIVEELLSARCYINTSFIENSSNSIQEAMLMGCPCIAAHTGGNPSIIKDGESGLLVQNGCAFMFADAVQQLLENDDLCQTLGSNARATGLARNDPECIINQLKNAYNLLI